MKEKTLKLPLTFHWYDETESGNKRTEYREMSDHWKRIIWDKRDEFTHVRFQRGFQPPIQHQTFKVVKIDIGPCPIEGWNDEYYRIHFEEKVESTTCFDCKKPFDKEDTELCPDGERRCVPCLNGTIEFIVDEENLDCQG